METDVEIHSQILGEAQEILGKRGWNGCGARGVKDSTGRLKESTNLGS